MTFVRNSIILQHHTDSACVGLMNLKSASRIRSIIVEEKKQQKSFPEMHKITVPESRSLPAGPRLYLETVFLRDFKSYAGTVMISPFHPGMTTIIGPNGERLGMRVRSTLS